MNKMGKNLEAKTQGLIGVLEEHNLSADLIKLVQESQFLCHVFAKGRELEKAVSLLKNSGHHVFSSPPYPGFYSEVVAFLPHPQTQQSAMYVGLQEINCYLKKYKNRAKNLTEKERKILRFYSHQYKTMMNRIADELMTEEKLSESTQTSYGRMVSKFFTLIESAA